MEIMNNNIIRICEALGFNVDKMMSRDKTHIIYIQRAILVSILYQEGNCTYKSLAEAFHCNDSSIYRMLSDIDNYWGHKFENYIHETLKKYVQIEYRN
jgi:hypothetical protein